MGIVIRKAERKDVKDLGELFFQLTEQETDLEKLAARVEQVYELPHYYLAVAWDAETEQVAGTALGIICYDFCQECKNFMVVENVIVASRWRGQGVGRQLFHFLEEWGRQNDCTYSQLVASSGREGAHQFYENMGYGREKGFRKWFICV